MDLIEELESANTKVICEYSCSMMEDLKENEQKMDKYREQLKELLN